MKARYARTEGARGQILQHFPSYLASAYAAINEALDKDIDAAQQAIGHSTPEQAAIADVKLRHLERLKNESQMWSKRDIGISYTSAHEILKSEYKLRAFVWIAENLKDREVRAKAGVDEDLFQECRRLVNSLNDFATDYENGCYPARTIFGLLHRSIAPIVKALEPVIWAGSINGRWGMRVLRLGMAAEHYNDVVKIHRSNSLRWVNTHGSWIIRPARTTDIFGKEHLRNDLPITPRILPIFRLQICTLYWSLIGKASLRPSDWLWSYGGSRLRKHRKHEDELAAYLRFALTGINVTDPSVALSFSWSLESLKTDKERAAQSKSSRKNGHLPEWLYLRRSES